jgi:hypothetical protein
MATSEAQRLRDEVARCLRLANEMLQDEVSLQLRALAADYLGKAEALERGEQQQQVGDMLRPTAEPTHGVAPQA